MILCGTYYSVLFAEKGEEDIKLKEQCRGAVLLELKNMERACTDVPSILRALGIPVHGGEVCCIFIATCKPVLNFLVAKHYLLLLC